MKVKKAELKAIKQKMRKGFEKNLKTSIQKEAQTSSGDNSSVTDVKHNVSLLKYLRGVSLGMWEGAEIEHGMFKKALGENTATRGGVLVPTEISNEIIPALQESAVVRQMPGVRTINMKTNKLEFERTDNLPQISWGRENVEISEDTNLSFGRSTLELKKATCLYKQSRELIMDAMTDMEGLVRGEIVKALAREEDKVFLEGQGGDRPLGFYYNPSINNTDLSGQLTQDNIRSAMYQLRLNNSAEANGIVAHPRTAFDLATLKDGEGRPIFGSGEGQPIVNNIWGMKLAQTTETAITLRPGTDETYFVLGDWSQFIVGQKPSIRIETSTEASTAFTADQVWIKLVRRVGSLVRQPLSFALVSGIQTRV